MSETKSTTALAIRGETSNAVVLQAPSGGFMAVTTFVQAVEVANFISKSALVPDAYRGKPADIVIAMQLGMEIGLAPLQSLQSIAVINGRPSLWGDAMKGLVVGLADCEDIIEQSPSGDEPDKWVATCTVKRRHRSPVVSTYSWADAKKAGLAGKKGPWQEYPKRMLLLRARGFALRDAFPDRLRGIISTEEAHDYPEQTTVISEPKRIGESSTVPPPVPVVPPTDTPAAAPSPSPAPAPITTAPADQSVAGVSVVNTSFQRDKDDRPLYEVLTSEGIFYTRDEAIYTALSTLEGTDHTATLTFRIARKGGQTARVLVGIQVEEPAAAENGGDQ